LLVGTLVAREDAAKKDLEALQGEWVMHSSERDGKKMTEEEVKGFHRTVKGNAYSVLIDTEDGQRELKGTITLDPSRNPKWIDAKMTNGSMAGKTLLGIYKLEDGRQTVCFAPPEQKRPTAFDSKQGVLTVWKREKKGTSGKEQEQESPAKTDSATADKSAQTAPSRSLRQIVDECNRQAIADFKKGDMLAVARGYADDATIYFPYNKKVHGRKAIDAYWQGIKGAKDWKLETLEVGGTPEAIWEVGKSSLTTEVDGKANTYVCDYVVIWKRQKDGSYRTHTDIFN
jgi:uncharacterized protein (TIGR03067 family)